MMKKQININDINFLFVENNILSISLYDGTWIDFKYNLCVFPSEWERELFDSLENYLNDLYYISNGMIWIFSEDDYFKLKLMIGENTIDREAYYAINSMPKKEINV